MKNNPTKSFLMLLLLVVLVIYTAVILTKTINLRESMETFPAHKEQLKQAVKPSSTAVSADPMTWKKYTNTKYNFSFSYPSSWQPKAYSLDKDYDVIELVNSNPTNPVKIYVSSKDYFAMAGLTTKKTTLSGKPAVSFKDMLVGVKADKFYYTFDIGYGSVTMQSLFKNILASVSFNQVAVK